SLLLIIPPPPRSTLFPYTTLFRSLEITSSVGKFDILVNVKGGGPNGQAGAVRHAIARGLAKVNAELRKPLKDAGFLTRDSRMKRSEEHTSELQSLTNLVCRLLLEK